MANEPDPEVMGRIRRVTKARLENRANYRSQLNVDKRLWAYGYNALVAHYDRPYVSGVRNYLVGELESDLKGFLRERIQSDPGFAESLEHYLNDYIDEDLRADAESFYASLGWERPNR